MNRRGVLRGLGATVGVGMFAGCSALGGGSNSEGSDGPFAATIRGPYSHRVNHDVEFLWARITLESVPDEWPEEDFYRAWIGTEANGPTKTMTAMEGFQPTPNFRYRKGDFVDDGSLTVDGNLEETDEVEPGTTFTFLAQALDTEKYYTLGKLTYEGDATEKAPSKVP